MQKSHIRKILGVLFLCCSSLSAISQPLPNIKQPLKLADQGHVEAQVFVADSYYMGRNGFPQNDSLALQYYQAAAKQNHPSAQFTLVTMYLEGEGTAVNKQLAFDFLNKAAHNDVAAAQFMLGHLYMEGDELLPADPIKAQYWLEKSAKNQFPQAQIELDEFIQQQKTPQE